MSISCIQLITNIIIIIIIIIIIVLHDALAWLSD